MTVAQARVELDAGKAYARARPGQRVVGWLLDPAARGRLLARWPPRYGRVVAHHVTLRPRVSASTPFPREVAAEIVGIADDGEGVQALVVRIDGSSRRPDGGTYHVTWSLANGRRAVESNAVISAHGWSAIEPPIPVALQPGLVG